MEDPKRSSRVDLGSVAASDYRTRSTQQKATGEEIEGIDAVRGKIESLQSASDVFIFSIKEI